MTEHFDTASPLSAEPKRPLKVFLCHAHADRDAVGSFLPYLIQDGVDAWLDKEKPCGERSAVLSLSKCRTILPRQGLDKLDHQLDLQDWELEIRKV